MTPSAATLIATLLAVAEPPPAATVAGARVLLWPDSGVAPSDSVEGALASQLGTLGVAAVPSSTLRDAPDVAERMRADKADRDRIEAALAEARRAYLAFDFDGVAARVGALLSGDLETMTRRGSGGLLRRAARLAAQADLAAGRPDEARRRARLAAVLAGKGADGTGDDSASLPPEYLRLESEARDGLGRLISRAFTVAPDPAGARVSFDAADGSEPAPVTRDLVPGDHVVRIEAPGRAPLVAVAEVGPDGGVMKPVLDTDKSDVVLLRLIADGAVNPVDTLQRQALLARALASHVVVYRGTAGRPGAVDVRVHPASGPWQDVGSGQPDAPLARRIADALAPERHPVPPAALPPAGNGGDADQAAAPRPVWARWWFWTAAGVLVAGGVAGGLLLARTPEQHATVTPK